MSSMFVVKRDGRTEPVHFDKITARITKLSYGLNPEFCDPVRWRGRAGRRGGAASAGDGGGGRAGGARRRRFSTRAQTLPFQIPEPWARGAPRSRPPRPLRPPAPAVADAPDCSGRGKRAETRASPRLRPTYPAPLTRRRSFSLPSRSSSPKKSPPASTRASPRPSWTSWRPRRRRP